MDSSSLVQKHKKMAFAGAWRYAPAAFLDVVDPFAEPPANVSMVSLLEQNDYRTALTRTLLYFIPRPRWAIRGEDAAFKYLFPALKMMSVPSILGHVKYCQGQKFGHDRSKSSHNIESFIGHWVNRVDIDPETGYPHACNALWRIAIARQIQMEEMNLAPVAPAAF